MAEPEAVDLLQGCGLPRAWAGQNAWRILDTGFERGLPFLNTWRAWKNDPQRPRLLHYVALTSAPPKPDELLACAAPISDLKELAQALRPQWFGLLPGFHRLTLEGGQVLLTLCVGEVTALLREQRFVADAIYLNTPDPDGAAVLPWNSWTFKALARCCRRGTRLASTSEAAGLHAGLTQCGFELEARQSAPATGGLSGQFNPRWTIKHTRDPAPGHPVEPGSCAVIGAGLAGASVAATLARRGWQVRVLDQARAPAAGASGLPAGLVVPHVSGDDCTLSRLSRSGVRLMLQQARSLLRPGQDWNATGTLERHLDGSAGLPLRWSTTGQDWSHPAPPETTTHGKPAIWHKQAAWLKPAQLVQAWLAQPGVTFQGGARVDALRPDGDQWALLDAQGQVLARADRVVFANAGGALPLLETLQTTQPSLGLRLDQLPALHGVRGQLSWALHQDTAEEAFPPFPVNGAGSVIPGIPVDGAAPAARAWFVGSSYQPDTQPALPEGENHAANLARLQQLLPALGQALAPRFAAGAVQAWSNTRCVSADRLPLVGPLYQADRPGLWICAGMGSRGLSFSMLCAELLAARWGAEPLPVEAGLANALNALRANAAP
jgi:tRNA 5-methylaminomethyl-2-thiouridine biosynthesis bifunctional protein